MADMNKSDRIYRVTSYCNSLHGQVFDWKPNISKL